uniref:Uncharacterized protein n=1 Tax=Parascaris equorum TaxID=6256 RepID=A0A914R9V0_PAREQ
MGVGVDIWVCVFYRYVPMVLDRNYLDLKNQVIKAERKLLNALGFVVHVRHPHKLIYAYLLALGCTWQWLPFYVGEYYMNDGLRADIFLRYRPETIACASISLILLKLYTRARVRPFKCSFAFLVVCRFHFIIRPVMFKWIMFSCYKSRQLSLRSQPRASFRPDFTVLFGHYVVKEISMGLLFRTFENVFIKKIMA